VVKRFYYYEHRTTSLRELFIRSALRRPLNVRRPLFTLREFELSVERGSSVALIGPNGSGKSTALRLIAGIYEPTHGTVETFGRVGAVIDLGAGFHPELTGAENLALHSAVVGVKRQELAKRNAEVIEFAGIEEFIDTPVKYYSSGMQARLAFAAAVCVEPDILLIDEVLAVGDSSFRTRCIDRLKSFQDCGGTLVVVSHDLPLIRSLCTRALWLDAGRILMDGEVGVVIDAYEGRTTAPTAPRTDAIQAEAEKTT
jgi:ABC-type polysaccharide/polyol phosphate transport system ATPase subunit